MAVSETIYLARQNTDDPLVSGLFRPTTGGEEPAGWFSYDERRADPTAEATLEPFTVHVLRHVGRHILRSRPERRLVHAGGPVGRHGAALILAPTRGGWTTLSLAGVLVGLDLLGDGGGFVDVDAGLAQASPRAARLRPGALDLTPAFRRFSLRSTVDLRGEKRYYVQPTAAQTVRGLATPLHCSAHPAWLSGGCGR